MSFARKKGPLITNVVSPKWFDPITFEKSFFCKDRIGHQGPDILFHMRRDECLERYPFLLPRSGNKPGDLSGGPAQQR